MHVYIKHLAKISLFLDICTLVRPAVNHLICLKCVDEVMKLPVIEFSIYLTKKTAAIIWMKFKLGGLAPRASQKGTFFCDKDHHSIWQITKI